MNKVFFGDCRESMRKMIADGIRVQMCVTSPPYFGLRDYGHPGQIGLEATSAEFLAAMVEVFGLVREVLADDGVLFLNLGDTYSTGVANVTDLLKRELERGVIFYGSADPRGRSAERINVLVYDKRAPNLIFKPLFAAERVSIKQGQHDLSEIGGSFNAPVECFSSCTFGFACPDDSDTQLLVNLPEYVGIIIAAGDLRTDAALRKTIALTVKDRKASLSIEISAEPIAEGIASSVPRLDTVTFNAETKSISEVDSVNDAVSLLDRSNLSASDCCDFAVREARPEKLFLTLHDGADICFVGVGHLFLLDVGLTPYSTLLVKAQQSFNENKPKQELGIPEMVKRALMRDGWICRQTIIWHKPNPMPESVRDRCTKAHEYLFLLTKSEKYYYDQDAILEPVSVNTHARLSQDVQNQIGSERANGGAKTNGNMKAVCRKVYPGNGVGFGHGIDLKDRNRGRVKNNESFDSAMAIMPDKRNKRSVWTIPTERYSEAHFATFPQALVEPCILAGSRPGDIVFDPFFGSGTVGQVAQALGRQWIGCELNPDYEPLQLKRTAQGGLML